jgi:hypothetical protein
MSGVIVAVVVIELARDLSHISHLIGEARQAKTPGSLAGTVAAETQGMALPVTYRRLAIPLRGGAKRGGEEGHDLLHVLARHGVE